MEQKTKTKCQLKGRRYIMVILSDNVDMTQLFLVGEKWKEHTQRHFKHSSEIVLVGSIILILLC